MTINKYELVRETVSSYKYNHSISGSDDAVQFLNDALNMNKKDREQVAILSLDSKMNVIGVSIESVGDINTSPIHPREIFKQAIISNATAIIMAHNHPTGDNTPSTDDITVTKRIDDAGKLLGIRLIDHVIIGDSYTSMRSRGYID